MKNIEVFKNEQFGEIRTIEIDNKTYFIANDMAKALGYSNTSDAISRHCRWVVKHDIPHPQSQTKMIEVNVIPEGDIYRLISNSELPQAEKFESWVFDEVLPTIRKHGMYATDELLDNPDLLIEVATKLKEERALRIVAEKKVEVLTPKAEFYDEVAGSKDAIEMADVAKVLSIKGLGRNKLFELLRDKKVLQPNNIPYQLYVDREYFRVLEQKYTTPKGETKINIKTLVFQKGIDYIRKIVKELN